jgi:O-antigen/teichoic acid export membrane protein
MIVPGALDTVVLGYFRSASVVGMYNAIIPMAKLVFLGSFALAAIMLPVSARLLKHGEVRELRESYATSTKWIAIASLPFFVVFFAFPDQSLAFVYGPSAASAAYAMAPTTLRIMSVGAFAATLLGPAGSVLVGMGRLRLVVANMGASVAVDFFGSVLLVPSLGAEGAAIAFSAALVTPAILAVAETRRLLSIDALRWSLAKPLALVLLIVGGGLGMAAGLLHWTPSGLQLVGLFFSVVALYALGILLTRSVEPVDTHLLGIVEKRLGRPLAPVRRLSRRFLDESQVPPARGTEPDSRFL